VWYEPLIVALVVVLVVVVVAMPLRRGSVEDVQRRESAELAELEAAKEAKYREIRDAELDLRTGKLSIADHRALDRALRAEAIELLRRLDRLAPATNGSERSGVAQSDPRPLRSR
jgi:hypothetical protein